MTGWKVTDLCAAAPPDYPFAVDRSGASDRVDVHGAAVYRIGIRPIEAFTDFRGDPLRTKIVRSNQADDPIDLGVRPHPIERGLGRFGRQSAAPARAVNRPSEIDTWPRPLGMVNTHTPNHVSCRVLDDTPLTVPALLPMADHVHCVLPREIEAAGRLEQCDLLLLDDLRIPEDIHERLGICQLRDAQQQSRRFYRTGWKAQGRYRTGLLDVWFPHDDRPRRNPRAGAFLRVGFREFARAEHLHFVRIHDHAPETSAALHENRVAGGRFDETRRVLTHVSSDLPHLPEQGYLPRVCPHFVRGNVPIRHSCNLSKHNCDVFGESDTYGAGLMPEGRTVSHALLVAIVAAAVAGTTSDVGSWNDAGRLATVESLVDRHTWQMDGSIFLARTMDRAYIEGHFYSHRSPTPSLALAAIYQVAQWTTGLKAAESPAAFCYTMALFSSGLVYIIAVLSVERLAGLTDLTAAVRWPLTWSFAFGTVALTYSRAVNDHLYLLGVFGLLFVGLVNCASRGWAHASQWNLVALGTLLGLGYSIDLGVGPVLVLCVLAYLASELRPLPRLAPVLVGALPWIALHHGVTYMIGGTFKPLGAVAEYMTSWQGSPFTVENLTGLGWAHTSVAGFLIYTVGFLVGPKGFLVHNPVLFFLPPALLLGWCVPRHGRGLVWCSVALMLGTWLMYAISSNNYAGETASIRWFVPLLVPSYYLLMLAVKERPNLRNDIFIVGVWSIVLGLLLWRRGPWISSIGPRLWVVNAGALVTWTVYRLTRRPSR